MKTIDKIEEIKTKQEMFLKKKTEAITEKVMVGLEMAAWCTGGIAAVVFGTMGTTGLINKLFEGYDEDNPAGVGRLIAGVGVVTVGMTATTLASIYATEKAIDAAAEFMEIEIPSEEDFKEEIEEVENVFNPEDKIFIK